MSQDNPEAGDVFVCPGKDSVVYLLVRKNHASDILNALWLTHSSVPTIRPNDGYPRVGDKYLCNINKLLRTIERKLVDAATDH